MILTLSPVASNRTSIIQVDGDSITVDGHSFDLTALPNDSMCDAVEPAIGVVVRQNNVLRLSVVYYYDSALAEPVQSSNPQDYVFNIEFGEVPSPIRWRPIEPPMPTDFDEPIALVEDEQIQNDEEANDART